MKRAAFVTTLLLAATAGAIERERPTPPDFKISILNLLVGRVNPLGLEDQLTIGPLQRLYHKSHPALSDNFIFFGVTPKLNPAYLRFGPQLAIQPASVFTLRGGAELQQDFGSFGITQSFGSPLDDWSDTALNRGKDAGRSYVTRGVRLYVEPTIRLKVGPIALVNRMAFEYWVFNLRAGDTVFYDQTLDTLVPNNGWVLANDLDVVWVAEKWKFVLGIRYSAVHNFYEAKHFRPDEPKTNLNDQQRLGPIFAYTFFDHHGAKFDHPTLVVIVNWYAQHRFRTGADVNAGVPYAVLGFAFTSDLIP